MFSLCLFSVCNVPLPRFVCVGVVGVAGGIGSAISVVWREGEGVLSASPCVALCVGFFFGGGMLGGVIFVAPVKESCLAYG